MEKKQNNEQMVLLMWRVSWFWFEHSNRLSLLLPLSQARTIRFLERCVFYCGSAWHSSLRLFCQRNGREVSSTLVWRPPFAADSEWNSNCLPHRLQCSSCMLMYADVCSSQKNMFVTTQGSEKEGILCQIEKTCVFYILILPAKNIRKIVIKKRHANRNNFLKQKGNKSDRLLMFQRKRFHIWAFYSILPEFQLGIGLRISLPENMFGFLPAAVPWKNGSFTLTCTMMATSHYARMAVIMSRPAWAHSAPVLSRWWPHVAAEGQRL